MNQKKKIGILLAHGSKDPLWVETFQKLLEKVRAKNSSSLWELAFLEISSPDLKDCLKKVVSVSPQVTDIKIIPVFMAAGKHLREDLPRLVEPLQKIYPHVRIEIGSVLGEEEAIQDALAHFISHSFT